MKVIGFGAALVDKQFFIKDDALNDLALEKGLMTLNSEEEQNELLTFLPVSYTHLTLPTKRIV